MNKRNKPIKNNIINRVKPEPIETVDDSTLPKKDLFRVDEVAAYFNVSRSTIYLWVDHGILKAEKYNGQNGTIRISRKAILSCRFNNRLDPLK